MLKKIALIVETRQNYMAVLSIRNAMNHLSENDWDFYIYTSDDSFTNYYGKLFNNLKNLKNHLNESYEILTADDYNSFMVSYDVWKTIGDLTDKCLIYQHDSWILKNNIDEFLDYDYVGGPWWDRWYGGNGGFSIRTPKVMLKVIENFNPKQFQSRKHEHFMEDVYFSNLTDFFGKMASREVNEKFSLECCYKENTFGIHKYHLTHYGSQDVSNLLKQELCTEIEKDYLNKCLISSDINEHLPIIREYAEKCQTVVEFGVGPFTSTYALATSKVKKMTSYNIEYSPIYLELNTKINNEKLEFKYIMGDVLNVVIDNTDLLFIDTLHQYTQLKKELEIHHNNVNKYIIIHDTTTYGEISESSQNLSEKVLENYVEDDKGVWLDIQEFLDENPSWVIDMKLENNNGLTVLKKIH